MTSRSIRFNLDKESDEDTRTDDFENKQIIISRNNNDEDRDSGAHILGFQSSDSQSDIDGKHMLVSRKSSSESDICVLGLGSDSQSDLGSSTNSDTSDIERENEPNNSHSKKKELSSKKVTMLKSIAKQRSTISASFRNRPLRQKSAQLPPPPPPESALPANFLHQIKQSSPSTTFSSSSINSINTLMSSFQSKGGDGDDDTEWEDEEEDSPVAISGMMLKKSNRLKIWRKRFVVLHMDTGELEWYRNRANYVSGVQTTDRIRITHTTRLWQNPSRTSFTLQQQDKEWSFDASTSSELFKWLEPLCQVFRKVLDKQLKMMNKTRTGATTVSVHDLEEELKNDLPVLLIPQDLSTDVPDEIDKEEELEAEEEKGNSYEEEEMELEEEVELEEEMPRSGQRPVLQEEISMALVDDKEYQVAM